MSRGSFGQFYGLFGLSSHEVPPPGAIPYNLRAAALDQLGHLVKVAPYRPLRDVSDVGDQDYAWTVTRTKLAPVSFPDSNPNAVLNSRGHRFYPSGFAAGSDGSIYVSNCSIAPAGGLGPQLCKNGGQVVRIS